MQIAVLIYGRILKCSNYYDNLISSIGQEHTIDFFLSSDNSCKIELENFINIYNPILYKNDKIDYLNDLYILNQYIINSSTNLPNMICHFINKNRVYNLLQKHIINTNTNYDNVISLRLDVIMYNKFNFSNIDDNSIYIPSGFDYEGLNDQIAYGKLPVLEKYMNIYNNCNMLMKDKSCKWVHPEALTLANMNFYNIKIHRTNLHYEIKKNYTIL